MSTYFRVQIKDSWSPYIGDLASLMGELNTNCREHLAECSRHISLELENLNYIADDKLDIHLLSSIMIDLAWHGWRFTVDANFIEFSRPSDESSKNEDKDNVRKLHERDRDIQLSEPSVNSFLNGFEKPRLTSQGRFSIFSLMRSGPELAEQLKYIRCTADKSKRIQHLKSAIDPYIQIIESDAICQFTGFKLQDIWRYFRHTWSTTYKSLPGRTVNILIRDAAAPNHPVIGIAALGSSIIQQSTRDQWIGWDIDSLLKSWLSSMKPKTARLLLSTLQDQIDSIHIQDFKDQGVLVGLDLSYPREKIITRLIDLAEKEKSLHHSNPHQLSANRKNADWYAECRTHLYRSKRASVLAELLSARATFNKYNLSELRGKHLSEAVATPDMTKAIGRILKSVKSENVGIHMMDIVVCGAIEPYSAILGGKLVCMLLASPEITQYYNSRYSTQVSVIASSMKGEAVTRKPQLSLLCTTSLYGSGSSQYNRVSIPMDVFGKSGSEALKFEKLGKSEGFGTFHFSSQSNKLFNEFQNRGHGQGSVNNIFGEGVNPLMRKIRQGLGNLGIDASEVLRHKSSRILYGVALANNFRDVLIGRGIRAKYKIPQSRPMKESRKIIKYWLERWLDARIFNDDVLESVSRNEFVHPIEHGARPKHYMIKNDSQENLDLWED